MRRRNPDEEIRAAEKVYFRTHDPMDKEKLVSLQRRGGMTCQREDQHYGSKLPVLDLCDYCHAFICDLCLRDHNQPLPGNYFNVCINCDSIFTDENPCHNSRSSSTCFKHYHREGYCASCWQGRQAEIQHEVDADNDPQYFQDDYDPADYDD